MPEDCRAGNTKVADAPDLDSAATPISGSLIAWVYSNSAIGVPSDSGIGRPSGDRYVMPCGL